MITDTSADQIFFLLNVQFSTLKLNLTSVTDREADCNTQNDTQIVYLQIAGLMKTGYLWMSLSLILLHFTTY